MTTEQIRARARACLKGQTGPALVASLILFGAGVLLVVLIDSALLLSGLIDLETENFTSDPQPWQAASFVGAVAVLICVWLLAGSPLQIGKAGFFRAFAANEQPPLDRVFAFFRRGAYSRGMELTLRLFLRRFALLVLFSLPGVGLLAIAARGGMFWPFLALGGLMFLGAACIGASLLNLKTFAARSLLASCAELTPQRAIRLSASLMKGHKTDLFLLRLSFVGWFALTPATVGLSLIYVIPYYNAAMGVFIADVTAPAVCRNG